LNCLTARVRALRVLAYIGWPRRNVLHGIKFGAFEGGFCCTLHRFQKHFIIIDTTVRRLRASCVQEC